MIISIAKIVFLESEQEEEYVTFFGIKTMIVIQCFMNQMVRSKLIERN